MGRGLFFWCARWPGGAGFAGTADIASRYCLKNGCSTYWSVPKNFAPLDSAASPRPLRYAGDNFEFWSRQCAHSGCRLVRDAVRHKGAMHRAYYFFAITLVNEAAAVTRGAILAELKPRSTF